MKNPLVSDAAATINDEIRAAQERGEDPFGDDEPLVKNLPQVADDTDHASEDDQTIDPPAVGAADNENAIDQAALEAVASEDTPARPTYDSPEARDFDAERKTLRGSKAEVLKQWNDGELSDEEYAAKIGEVDDQLDALLTAKTRAETIQDLNEQAARQTQIQIMSNIATASAKAKELDYSDPKVCAAYDSMLKDAVMKDPENAGKTFDKLAQLAHDALCTTRGVKRAAPAADPDPKPKRETPPIPMTLRGLPNASVANTGGSRIEAISRLTGQAYQDAFAKLSAAEKAQLLDE